MPTFAKVGGAPLLPYSNDGGGAQVILISCPYELGDLRIFIY